MTTDSSTTLWTVQERAWKEELPDLPDEVVALLATPVVVSASAWTAQVPVDPEPAPALALVRPPRLLSPAAPAAASRTARRRTAGRAVPRAAARIA
ncbi:hypothetical protein ACFFX1_53355 [Dactylosporangium sucinum]|uniref:Uncharacterized protein n=1 Tax=Dactylosporangium sucinum TaxID=1424081 RepID=A0A917X4J7_9ACTN|nr:hypothetical protein [Dactylosporangium sucinum]GGM72303.1 hypothetical protein GCM10007977_087510 [Dactylosporangium sucinum]